MSAKAAAPLLLGRVVADFTLPSTGQEEFRLRALRGHNVVLYFYPRDDTPGCTLEGQDFQRLLPAFERAATRVFGVSRDTLAAHQKFCGKFGFDFALLADESGAVCTQFDVIRVKNMYGRKLMGLERSTFLIDAHGKLRQEWRKLKVTGHAAEVLEAAKAL